jgi:hypothetical protein
MNDHVAPYVPIVFPENPVDGQEFDAPNGVTYRFDGVVWVIANGGGGIPPGVFLLKAGDTVEGRLTWPNNATADGRVIEITNGSIQVDGGGVRVTGAGEIQSPVFVAVGDPAGFAFGTPAQQNGGIYKKAGEGVVIREDIDGHKTQIESNDGSQLWEIMDDRGGRIRRQGFNRGLDFVDDGEPDNFASFYQDGAGNFILRKGNPGFAQATCVRTRPGDPARLEIIGEPEQPLDAANKAYVDRVATGAATIIGAIDASTGDCRLVSDPDNPGVVPPAASVPTGSYLICVVAGTIPGGEAAGISMAVGDWLISDGAAWFDLPVGNPGVATTARQVSLIPTVFGGGEVQTGMENAEATTDALDARVSTAEGNISTLDGQIADLDAAKLDRAGDTMQGQLFLQANVQPVGQWEAVHKDYVDDAIGNITPPPDLTDYALDAEVVHLAGDTMTGRLVLQPVNPQNQWDAVPKVYVDNLAVGAGRMLIGTIDASTGLCTYTTASGLPNGPLVPADQVTAGNDIICSVAGTIPPGIPAAGTTMQVGDILISDGQDWIFIALPHIPQTADQIGVVPSVFGANNVQAALEAAEGQVLPPGGTPGQVLAKATAANFDTMWVPPGGGDGGGGAFLPITGGALTGPLRVFSAVQPQIELVASTESEIRWLAQTGGSWTWHYDGVSGPFRCRFTSGGAPNTREFLTLTPNAVAGQPGTTEINGPTIINGNVSAQNPTLDGHLATKVYVDSGDAELSLDIAAAEARSIARDTDLAADIVALEGRSQAADAALSDDIAAAEARSIARDDLLVPLAGGTMTGPLLLDGNPTVNAQAANKAYVDALFSGAALLRGVINAATGITTDVEGTQGPLPTPTGSHDYFICTNAGTIPSGPAQGITMRLGDQIYDVGTLWVLVAVGTGGVAATASEVALVPNVVGANNVQTALETISTGFDIAAASPTLRLRNTTGNARCTLAFGIATEDSFHLYRNSGNTNLGLDRFTGSPAVATPVFGIDRATGALSYSGAITITGNNNLTVSNDGYGVFFMSGCAVYKKAGTGLTLRRHTGNIEVGIENVDGSNRQNILTAATGMTAGSGVLKAGDNLTGSLRWASTLGVGAPNATGTSAGNRLMLWDAAANPGFGLGIEPGHLWLNTAAAANGIRFYLGAVLHYFMNNNSFDVGGKYITNLRDPGNTATDAANKRYVDTRISRTGDTMTGQLTINMGNNTRGILLHKPNRDANTHLPSIDFTNSKNNTAIGRIICWQEAQWYAYQDYSRVEFHCGSGIQRRTMYGTANDLYVASRVFANNVQLSSDISKKMDVAPADEREAVAAFDKLKPIRFRWKPGEIDNPLAAPHGKSQAPHPDPHRLHWGFVAQDVEAAAPDLVTNSRDEGKSIDLGGLVAMMAAKIQSLEARLAANGL